MDVEIAVRVDGCLALAVAHDGADIVTAADPETGTATTVRGLTCHGS